MKIFFISSLLQYRMRPSWPLQMEFGSGFRIHPEVQCHHISPIICKSFIMENYFIKCSPQRFVVMAKYHSHQGYILYWSETAKLTWFNLPSRHVWCFLTTSIQWWITLIKVIFWCLQSKVGGHASTRGKWPHIVNFSGIHCILLFIQIYSIILHLYFRTIAWIVLFDFGLCLYLSCRIVRDLRDSFFFFAKLHC